MQHLRERLWKTNPQPVHKWVAESIANGFVPKIKILESFDSGSELKQREVFWIAKFESEGFKLENCGIGGPGYHGRNLPVETRAKISRSLMGNKRFKPTLENRMKISLSKMGKKTGPRGPMTEETKIKLSLAKKGKPSPLRGATFSSEAKERMRQAQIKRYQRERGEISP